MSVDAGSSVRAPGVCVAPELDAVVLAVRHGAHVHGEHNADAARARPARATLPIPAKVKIIT
jgi:hypothetical protein